LDELFASDRPLLQRLVIKALVHTANRNAMRMESEPISTEAREREWRPSSTEHLACLETALDRLIEISHRAIPELKDALVDGATKLSMLLRERGLRDRIIVLFDAIYAAYADTREGLRRAVANVLNGEKKYWKDLSASEIAVIEELHSGLEDRSIAGRLRQAVGTPSWDLEQEVDLSGLAAELVRAPSVLAADWRWLTSGDAHEAWRLGEALAAADTEGELQDMLSTFPERGADLRVLAGYVHRRRAVYGDNWLGQWLTRQLQRDPNDSALLFEVAWRSGPTQQIAQLITRALREHVVDPRIAGQLAFGDWALALPSEAVGDILQALSDRGHRGTALAILARRLKAQPDERDSWAQLALQLISATEVIRSTETAGFYWKEVVDVFLDQHAATIAAAIFQVHADRSTGPWFAEYGEAADVILRCAERDPIGVWSALTPYISSRPEASLFEIGFPRGVLERIPYAEVINWVSQDPEERAPIAIKLASLDLSADTTLAARLMTLYGDNERVGSALFGEYISGSWYGSAADHWNTLAAELQAVAERTSLSKLRRWAREAAGGLRQMAERDQRREAEDDLRRRA
jgi:hypothetical protein